MIRTSPLTALLIALPLAALSACGQSDETSKVTTVQNDQSGETETVIESDRAWRLTSSASAGAAALFSDSADQSQIAVACPVRGLIEVTLAGATPAASEDKLTIAFGSGAPIDLSAVATIDRNGSNSLIPGAMKAAGPAPKELRGMMESGEISVAYGGRSYGPFPSFPNDVRQRMVGEC